ncbi:DUF4760 domain-containing protein [Streptomyces sp. NPDC003007]
MSLRDAVNAPYGDRTDSSVVFNVVTTAIAVVAVETSIVFSARQARTAKHANHISVLIDLLREFRSAEFHEQHDHVCTRLGAERDPENGVRGLPAEGSSGTYLSTFEELARLAADLPPEHVRDQMAEARRRGSRRGLMR